MSAQNVLFSCPILGEDLTALVTAVVVVFNAPVHGPHAAVPCHHCAEDHLVLLPLETLVLLRDSGAVSDWFDPITQ